MVWYYHQSVGAYAGCSGASSPTCGGLHSNLYNTCKCLYYWAKTPEGKHELLYSDQNSTTCTKSFFHKNNKKRITTSNRLYSVELAPGLAPLIDTLSETTHAGMLRATSTSPHPVRRSAGLLHPSWLSSKTPALHSYQLCLPQFF